MDEEVEHVVTLTTNLQANLDPVQRGRLEKLSGFERTEQIPGEGRKWVSRSFLEPLGVNLSWNLRDLIKRPLIVLGFLPLGIWEMNQERSAHCSIGKVIWAYLDGWSAFREGWKLTASSVPLAVCVWVSWGWSIWAVSGRTRELWRAAQQDNVLDTCTRWNITR